MYTSPRTFKKPSEEHLVKLKKNTVLHCDFHTVSLINYEKANLPNAFWLNISTCLLENTDVSHTENSFWEWHLNDIATTL